MIQTREKRRKNGEKQRGIMDLGEAKSSLDDSKHPSKCKWFNLSIFINFIRVLIVLSSITKKGEIVRKIAPLGHCFVILLIE